MKLVLEIEMHGSDESDVAQNAMVLLARVREAAKQEATVHAGAVGFVRKWSIEEDRA